LTCQAAKVTRQVGLLMAATMLFLLASLIAIRQSAFSANMKRFLILVAGGASLVVVLLLLLWVMWRSRCPRLKSIMPKAGTGCAAVSGRWCIELITAK
jgi:hypothetical protein